MDNHFFDFGVAVNFDLRPAIFLIAKREADVLEAGGKAKASTVDGGRWTLFSVSGLRSAVFPTGFFRGGLDDLRYAYRIWGGRAYSHRLPIFERVLQAEFHRVHAKFFGEFVHLAFGHEQGLRGAESAECRAGDIVGVNAINIRLDIGDEIWAGRGDGGVAENFVGCVHIRAAIPDDFVLRGDQFPIFGRTPFGAQNNRMTFGVTNQRLAA